uniref:Major sperm protein n=1 Tax=Parascaris univalens TaxID=6257 RepID=A0A915AAH4_PARUN
MLPQLLEVLQVVALPSVLLAIVLFGCGGDSRPKNVQPSKSKERPSGKGHSKSGKLSKKMKKGGSGHGHGSKSSKSKSKTKDKGKPSTSSSAKSSESSKKRSSSKKGVMDRSGKSASHHRSESVGRHSSRKMKKRADLVKLPDQKRRECEEVVDTSAVSRPIESEPQKDMVMEPRELRWSTTGGMQKVILTNPTEERRAIKVKCSDNNLYRVNPVFSFVEPGQSLGIDIIRHNGGAKIDKMVFVTAKAKPEDMQPRELFDPSVANPMLVLPLIAG